MKPKLPLWDHQKEALAAAKDLPFYALLFEMGTGKTATVINMLRQKCEAVGRPLKTLILCPPVVIPNWRNEFKLHSDVNSCNIIELFGPGKKRIGTFWNKVLFEKGKVVITNYESLLMGELYSLIIKWGPEVLILDESHKCKSITAKRTKKCIELSNAIDTRGGYRYILTGTPVLNSPMDVFAQYRILDGGRTFGKNFYRFRSIYFYDANSSLPRDKYFPNWQFNKLLLEDLNKKILSVGMRVLKKDCLDLPPLVKKKHYVDMTPMQKAHYDEMKKHFITYVNDKACVGQLAVTKGLRLQQIASGYIKCDDDTIVELKDTPREKALEELLIELTPNHKVIVWSVFHQNYKQIARVCNKLGVKYVECHGKISAKGKHESVRVFNEDASVKVFIGHPGAGGLGINLTVSSYSIFYSRNFSLEQDTQAEARNHRAGSEIHESVTRIDIVATGTIDEHIEKALASKMKIGEDVLKKIAGRL